MAFLTDGTLVDGDPLKPGLQISWLLNRLFARQGAFLLAVKVKVR